MNDSDLANAITGNEFEAKMTIVHMRDCVAWQILKKISNEKDELDYALDKARFDVELDLLVSKLRSKA